MISDAVDNESSQNAEDAIDLPTFEVILNLLNGKYFVKFQGVRFKAKYTFSHFI